MKKVLLFISSLFLFLATSFNVKADTYDTSNFKGQLLDNNNAILTYVTTDYTNNSYRGTIPYMGGYSSGAAWGVSSPVTLLANHTYTLTITIDGTYGGDIILSNYNRIGVGTTLDNAISSYTNNTSVNENYSRALGDGMTLQFAFTPLINSSYIVFPFATTSSGGPWVFSISNIVVDDLGSTGVTETEINNSLNNQTNIINNTITNMQDNINSNINDMQENINNTITDNFNNCGENVVTLTSRASGKYIDDSNGNFNSNSNFNVSNFYTIVPNSSYTINFNDISGLEWGYFCFYNDDSVVSCKRYNQTDGYSATNFVVTSPSNANKITLTYKANSNANISGNICVNRIDETNQQLGDLNNSLNNSDTSDATNEAGNFFSGFQTDTFGLTSIITAPLNLIGSITSSSCSPLGLQVPFIENTTLNLPCMSTIYQKHFGSFLSVYQIITFGIVAYWVCVRIFALVKDFKNPDHDEIEVLDL